jgi:hypothetical protein
MNSSIYWKFDTNNVSPKIIPTIIPKKTSNNKPKLAEMSDIGSRM